MAKLVPSFLNFLELSPKEQDWIYPMLGKAEKRVIDMLQAIEGKFLTYLEIAAITDSHPNTVKTTLYALRDGGIDLRQDKTGKWITPKGGRYRKLQKIGEIEE